MSIDMNVDRWIAVAGILFGAWMTYRYYRKSVRNKVLAMAYSSPLPLLLPMQDVELYYARGVQKALVRLFVLFWNRGTAPIEAADFIKPISLGVDSRILDMRLFDKDAMADVTVSGGDKSISITLLRPREAIIVQIDAAEESYRPDFSVQMKSPYMTKQISSGLGVIPYLAAALVASFPLLTLEYIPRLKDELLTALGVPDISNDAKLLGMTIIILLLGLLAFFVTQRLFLGPMSPVAARFFRAQMLLIDIMNKWSEVKKKIDRVTAN